MDKTSNNKIRMCAFCVGKFCHFLFKFDYCDHFLCEIRYD